MRLSTFELSIAQAKAKIRREQVLDSIRSPVESHTVVMDRLFRASDTLFECARHARVCQIPTDM